MKGSAMSSLAAIIRVPFYRVLVNLGAGVGAVIVWAIMPPPGLPKWNSSWLQDVSASIGPLSSFPGWLFLLIGTLVVGEVFCTAGETIIGLFFCSSPFRDPGNSCEKKPSNPKSSDNSGPGTDNTAGDTPDTDNNAADTIIEWVTPGSKHFVCYGSFTEDKNLGYSISEVHFCLARLFAGLMTVLLGLYCVYLPFVTALVAFASLIAISTTCRPNEKGAALLRRPK
jgi:hypothetical protein